MLSFSRLWRSPAVSLLLVSLAVSPSLTGCAAMMSVGRPSTALKAVEGAGLGVVVRRAQASSEVAAHVDRLLVETPVGKDADWPARLLITREGAERILTEASKSGTYANQPAEVMPVEAWARVLSEATSSEGEHASLMKRISTEMAVEYADVAKKNRAFLSRREAATKAEEDLDQRKGALAETELASEKAKVDRMDEEADAAEEAFQEAKAAFVEKVRTCAGKVPKDVRDETGKVLVRLREAVEDADKAIGAALVRYPLAAPSLLGDAQTQAKVFLADVIEEKSGKRPDTSSIQPSIELDGLTPKIGISGLSSKELGSLDVGEVTSETAARTSAWVGKALTLMAWAPSTASTLSYQASVLDAILDGFEKAGWQRPEDLEIEAKAVEED